MLSDRRQLHPGILLVAVAVIGLTTATTSRPSVVDRATAEPKTTEISGISELPGFGRTSGRWKFPFVFEPNVGQSGGDHEYSVRRPGSDVHISVDKIEVGLRGAARAPVAGAVDGPARRRSIRIDFLGTSLDARATVGPKAEAESNYLLGAEPANWKIGVPGFEDLTYSDAYPGIDIHYYRDEVGDLRFDVVVAPGVDPGVVALAALDAVEISEDGALSFSSPAGSVVLTRPQTFQDDGVEVESGYRLESDPANLERTMVRFWVGEYDRSKTLVIDPAVLSYSTYLGGSGDELGAVAVDSEGGMYVAGYTNSVDFPTQDPLQADLAGSDDIFVSRISADGSSLIYSTYLGGSQLDHMEDLVVDESSNVYVTGETRSTDFPTANAYQSTLRGSADAFVSKISADGSSLIYSTYLGGSGIDWAENVALDSTGAAYLTGNVQSSDFPTKDPFQANLRGSSDAFVTKLSPDGSSLVYSTYLGGLGSVFEKGEGLAVDLTGSAFVSGLTRSSSFPLVNPLQATYGGNGDAFLTKLDPSGSALMYSTYIGGSSTDEGEALAVDASGSVYLAGATSSSDFPLAGIPFQATFGGGSDDGFVAKVKADGSSMEYSTYLGGSSVDWVEGVVVGESGRAHVVGLSASANFPVRDAFQPNLGGSADAFVAQLNESGSDLVYSSFLGGDANDTGYARAALDATGAVYLAGFTESSTFPTVGPLQGSLAGGADVFVSKVTPPPGPVTISGTFTNGTWGALAVFTVHTGQLVEYYCCLYGDSWSIEVPASSCPGDGYKILFIPANEAQRYVWYDNSGNWSQAACVTAPSSGNDMDVGTPGHITGYVKDASDASDIDGAVVYAYRFDGVFAGWTRSGRDGPGRYRLLLDPTNTYKISVNGPPGLEDRWFDGAPGFSEATPIATPGVANFSLRHAATITGKVTQSGSDLQNAYISAYTTCGCTTPRNTVSDVFGNYSIKVASTAASGWEYKLRFIPPAGQTRWYLDAPGFGGAANITAPSSGIDQELPP